MGKCLCLSYNCRLILRSSCFAVSVFYSIVGTVKKLQCVPYPSLYVDAISSEKKNLPTKISGMRVTALKIGIGGH